MTGNSSLESARTGAWDVFSGSGQCVQWVGAMCSVSGPMCSLSGRMCSLWWPRCSVFSGAPWLETGHGRKAGFRLRQAQDRLFDELRAGSPTDCGSAQHARRGGLRGRRAGQGPSPTQQEAGDAGMTGMTGMCPLCQAKVSSFLPDVSTFRPNVSSFRGNVSTLAGKVSSEARRGELGRCGWGWFDTVPRSGSARTGVAGCAEDGRVRDPPLHKQQDDRRDGGPDPGKKKPGTPG